MDSIAIAWVAWDENWDFLYERLCQYAFSISRDMPSVFDGVSPDDLVGEVMIDFFSAPSNWDRGLGSLERYLKGAIKHRYLNHVARSLRQDILPATVNTIVEFPGLPMDHEAVNTERMVRLYAAAKGDPELEELVQAVSGLGPRNVNQQLAERLQTSVEDVENRRKRLARRVSRLNPRHGGS